MNDDLAERLLHQVLNLEDEELVNERSFVQAIASYKYDHYQQFAPGMRFIESLCLWLKQFGHIKERKIAYDFVKKNLIFISSSEMTHLIRMAFPDVIKKYLIQQTSLQTGLDDFLISKILAHEKFTDLLNRSLFLGLSDGAHIDNFRRFAQLRHEQVYPTYLISDDKSKDFIKKLKKYLQESGINKDNPKFEIAFLIDDFSGSGFSFLNDKETPFAGKIYRFYQTIINNQDVSNLFDLDKLKICVVLYLATSRAKQRIEALAKDLFKSTKITFSVLVVSELKNNILVNKTKNADLIPILQGYYTTEIESPSYKKGDMSEPHLGFDGCALPLVLYHNSPNNSLPLIWMDPERYDPLRGLFPRIERFVKE